MIFNLSKVIRENIHLLSKASKNKNIQIEILFDENILVFADINSVKTIIRNLVSNAINFSHPDGTISISVDEWLDFIEVGVRDTGVGMSEEDQQKIFDISAKQFTFGTNKEKCTGLGLILCKEFVERNHGRIKINSIIGVGATFMFTLPKSNESEIVQLEEARV